MGKITDRDGRKTPGLLGIGLFVLIVFQGVKFELPRVVTVAVPVAVETGKGFAFAAKLGDAAISLSWR